MSRSHSPIEAITLPHWAIGGRVGLCLSFWLAVLILGAASGGATHRAFLQTIGLLAALLGLTMGPAKIWDGLRRGGWVLLLPALLGLLQLVPLPHALLRPLAPLRAELLPPDQSWASLSLYPFATLDNAALWTVYALAFVFGGLAARNKVATLGWIGLAAVALGQAVYGILAQGVMRVGRGATISFAMAQGTFPTRDQFACFLALIAPLLLASLLMGESPWQRRHYRSRPELVSRLAIRGLGLAVLVLGVIFSFSRGGLAALGLGCGVVVAVAVLRARGHGRRTASMLLFVTIAVALAATGELVSQWMWMLRPEMLQADTRWPVWHSAWRVVADHPLLGTGLGSFPTAFLPYAGEAFGAFVMDAHSELIQLAIEIGLPAAVALYATLLLWIGRSSNAAIRTRLHNAAAALAGSAGSLAAFVLVSLFDFPFHVPSTSLIAFTLAGYAQALAQSDHGTASLSAGLAAKR